MESRSSLWQALHLSLALYDELIFCLWIPWEHWLFFNAFKDAFKACFLGWHFLTTNISPVGDLSSAPLSVRPIAKAKSGQAWYSAKIAVLSTLIMNGMTNESKIAWDLFELYK